MMHRIEIMGPEYVLILGAWWGVIVILAMLTMAIGRELARHGRRRNGHVMPEAASGRTEP